VYGRNRTPIKTFTDSLLNRLVWGTADWAYKKGEEVTDRVTSQAKKGLCYLVSASDPATRKALGCNASDVGQEPELGQYDGGRRVRARTTGTSKKPRKVRIVDPSDRERANVIKNVAQQRKLAQAARRIGAPGATEVEGTRVAGRRKKARRKAKY
jgi:hypothetical protein